VLDSISRIRDATEKFEKAGLIDDDSYIDLIAFYLGQIGEQFSSNRLDKKLLEKFGIDEDEQADIYAMRILLVHHYEKANKKIILKTLDENIPALFDSIGALKNYLTTEIDG